MAPRIRFLLVLLLVTLNSAVTAAPAVTVEGIMPDAAVLKIDGQRKMLRVGETFAGVTLLASRNDKVTLDIDGQRRDLGLSRYIGTRYQEPEKRVVTIVRDDRMQYLTTALINGRRTRVMVDTGANIVAISSDHAGALGIDYADGERATVETASGVANAYRVTLRSVDVGGIRVDNVAASVVEGGYPSTVLLGMSYLRHVSLKEDNGILSLSQTR